jgi:uncharacterized protein YecT (DUF1311 family)
MNYLPRLLAALLLTTCASSAFALDCKNALSTPEINECASIEQKKVEDKLNKVYQRIVKSVDNAEAKKSLVEAQRAWVKFRDADCKAVYQKWIEGTIRGVMFTGCMQNRAETRIKELEDYDGQN